MDSLWVLASNIFEVNLGLLEEQNPGISVTRYTTFVN